MESKTNTISEDEIRKLAESEQKFRFIAENASEVIFSLTTEGAFEFISNNIEPLSGYKPEEVLHDYFYKYVHPDDLQKVQENFHNILEGKIQPSEFRIVAKNNKILFVKSSTNLIVIDGEIKGVFGILTDITRLKLVEENLREIIDEKNMLMKEIHHRVKNNMQIIISMLKLESLRNNDPYTKDVFMRLIERITSMRMVHEHLYSVESLKAVSIKRYFSELIRHIESSYNISEKKRVLIHHSIDDLNLHVDLLVPLGLILNELLTNSFKYAFAQSEGLITVELLQRDKKNSFVLRVKDNGVGIDLKALQKDEMSLGLKLVQALVHQIEGTLNLSNEKGTTAEVFFSDKSETLN